MTTIAAQNCTPANAQRIAQKATYDFLDAQRDYRDGAITEIEFARAEDNLRVALDLQHSVAQVAS